MRIDDGLARYLADRRSRGDEPAPRADRRSEKRRIVPGRGRDCADLVRRRGDVRRLHARHHRAPAQRSRARRITRSDLEHGARNAAAEQRAARDAGRRASSHAAAGRRCDPGQERLPREHEPRAADAPERHHSLQRAAAGDRPRTKAEQSSRSPIFRRSSPRASICSRSSTASSTSRRSRPARWRSRVETFDVREMIDELLDTVGPLVRKNNNTLTVHCGDDVGIDELGSDEDPADSAQSAQQRRQVHARWRRHARGRAGGPKARTGLRRVHGHRYRRRHDRASRRRRSSTRSRRPT